MAYYRKRRRTFRRKRVGRKRSYRRNFKRKMSGRQPVHYFTRFVDKGLIQYNSTLLATEKLGVYVFRLSDVTNYLEFAAMYDMYRIAAVKISFIPISNVAIDSVVDGTSFNLPNGYSTNYFRFASVIDYNDNTTPSSMNVLREYRNCKITRNNVIHKRFIYPRIDNVIGQDNSTTVIGGSTKTWISTGFPEVQHYGIKYGFEQEPDFPCNRYKVECKYYLKFKNPK